MPASSPPWYGVPYTFTAYALRALGGADEPRRGSERCVLDYTGMRNTIGSEYTTLQEVTALVLYTLRHTLK